MHFDSNTYSSSWGPLSRIYIVLSHPNGISLTNCVNEGPSSTSPGCFICPFDTIVLLGNHPISLEHASFFILKPQIQLIQQPFFWTQKKPPRIITSAYTSGRCSANHRCFRCRRPHRPSDGSRERKAQPAEVMAC